MADTGRTAEANALVDDCTKRLDALSQRMSAATTRPRVFCMEWLDPVYASGHWVPELVKIAGGIDDRSRVDFQHNAAHEPRARPRR